MDTLTATAEPVGDVPVAVAATATATAEPVGDVPVAVAATATAEPVGDVPVAVAATAITPAVGDVPVAATVTAITPVAATPDRLERMLSVLPAIRELMPGNHNFRDSHPFDDFRNLRKPRGRGFSNEVWDEFKRLRRLTTWTQDEKDSIFTLWRLGL
jgi:hypothetical protein